MAQIEAATVQVTGVKLERTNTGLEITLETTAGKPLQVDATKFRTQGNNLIADISNAVLALPDAQAFSADNPTEEIANVRVIQLDASTIQVNVAGKTTLPTQEVTLKTGAFAYSLNPEADEPDEEIVVTGEGQRGYRVPNTSVGTRTDTPLRDIPQSIQIVPRQVIEDQKITRISDAVRNVSGVSPLTDFSATFDIYRSESHQVTATIDHRFNENFRIRSGFLGYFEKGEVDYVNPSDEFDADGRLLREFEEGDGSGQQDDLSWQTDLIAQFKTGLVKHQILLGLELSRSIRRYAGLGGADDIPALDIFNPVYGNFPRPTNFSRGNFFDATTDTVGIYLQDQVTLLPNLKLLLGGRYDFVNYKSKFDFETLDRSNIQAANFYDEAVSPRVGIVYQPIAPISLYASYSRSFVPNNNSSTASGKPLVPSRGTQYEVGIKAEITPQLSLTLAAYEITKTNVPTPDPDDDQFSIALGEVKSRGIELDIAGEILPDWKIIASAYVNDAFVSKDTDPALEGARFANTAKTGASLWTTYEFQKGDFKGFGFGAGLFYIGDRIANQSDPFTLPSYVRVDAAIFYKWNNGRIALNFKNLGNVKYYDTNGFLVFPQAPFTVLGTVSVEF